MYISKGSHNDFIRILMSIGFIGLFLYIMLLLNVGVRLLRYSMSMQFLGVGALAIIALYSISTTPLLYPPLMYVFIPIMCMLALPVEAMKEKNEQ
jgi:O-antigen ligase